MLSRTVPGLFARCSVSRMKVMVGVKRVVDYTVKVRVRNNKIQTESLKMSINPFDEIAIEEAVRLKEKKIATEVIAVTVGNKKAEEALRVAMALGCDKAIHIITPDGANGEIESLSVAKLFKKLHQEFKPDLWILGKQAVDWDLGTTAQLLAGLLNVPQGTFASEINISRDGVIKVTREVDVGHQMVELQMPCVVSADLRLNTPRLPKLPNIMKSRKKPIDVRNVLEMGVDVTPRLICETVKEPPVRQVGMQVKTVEELYEKLHNEAKVI
ncbi:electron transfer flavoprotein [Trypanosoma brucei equiperdum]|uniref:Electron transfer flavoprotein subunit beta n=1 Tax=Trypanosoma brucei equiperdum TaxID=630700 RepID=A0A3L6KWC9_9TRYP|nr:electron transfer flavoprotein [Trypanosoma brucei equiperdum]